MHQYRRRSAERLGASFDTDIVVVGGGIAGVATAYFLLTTTPYRVALVEAKRVGEGASGHNAGQALADFERSFSDMAQEFGGALASASYKAMQTAWQLFEELISRIPLHTNVDVCTGKIALWSREQIEAYLEDARMKLAAGIESDPMYVDRDMRASSVFRAQDRHLVQFVDKAHMRQLLRVTHCPYRAIVLDKRGCANSALLCEQLVEWMLRSFADRFRCFENTPIDRVELGKERGAVVHEKYKLTARKIILCTNGFESFAIQNQAGANIDTKFHHLVEGVVGYMAAYEDPHGDGLVDAASYYQTRFVGSDPYIYATWRPSLAHGRRGSMVCFGGPETHLADREVYKTGMGVPSHVVDELHGWYQTLKHPSRHHVARRPTYTWHGLMGYTPNRVRCIGEEPCNPVLMYNLGCNGIGMLPSIFGGKRIADMINGKATMKLIFDPRDQRCELPRAAARIHVTPSLAAL